MEITTHILSEYHDASHGMRPTFLALNKLFSYIYFAASFLSEFVGKVYKKNDIIHVFIRVYLMI